MSKKLADVEKQIETPFAGPSGKPWQVRSKMWAEYPFYFVPLVACPTTVLFRRHFGERYLNPLKMFMAFMPLGLYALCMRIITRGIMFWANQSDPVPISSWITWLAFSVLFFLLASWHMFAAVRRRKKFQDEFSFSDGRPWEWILALMPFVRNEWDFELYYEPLIIAIAGCLLIYFHNYFGPFLIMAGFASYLIAIDKYRIRRGEDLDRVDGMMVANRGHESEAEGLKKMPPIVPFGNSDRTDSSGGSR